MNHSIQLAAQADLVALTADMLRPPERGPQKPSWTSLTGHEQSELLHATALSELLTPNEYTLHHLLDDVIQHARGTSLEEWSDEYWRLFDGATLCPIHQASYIRRDKGAILGDVAGFYRAFGWRYNAASGDRPDHLICQLEFVTIALAMAAHAPGDDERLVTLEGLSSFARTHVHDWLPSFCCQLCETTRLPLFGAISNWLMRMWQTLSWANHWQFEMQSGERARPLIEQDNPYECAAQGMVQLGSH